MAHRADRCAESASGEECAGARVVVIDAGLGPGGQIWRHAPGTPPPHEARPWVDRLSAAGATCLFNTSAVDLRAADGGFAIVAEAGTVPCRVETARVVLATGARERFLPFPGWTLPGVVGVGGAQALLKAGTNVAGKRAVVAAITQRPDRLAYDDPRGARRLREALQAYLWRARTLRCDPDQIIIVNGSQQGLDL